MRRSTPLSIAIGLAYLVFLLGDPRLLLALVAVSSLLAVQLVAARAAVRAVKARR